MFTNPEAMVFCDLIAGDCTASQAKFMKLAESDAQMKTLKWSYLVGGYHTVLSALSVDSCLWIVDVGSNRHCLRFNGKYNQCVISTPFLGAAITPERNQATWKVRKEEKEEGKVWFKVCSSLISR